MDSLPQLSFINNRYRKTMRRTGVIALIMMLILNLFAAFYIHVADAATGQTIVMDKTQFKQSEAITLKYTGAAANGQDWIGIYQQEILRPDWSVELEIRTRRQWYNEFS